HIVFAIIRGIVNTHGVGFDGDTAFPLNIHGVQQLRLHVAILDRAGLLDEPVRKGGFTMVNMRHDREISNMFKVGHFWVMRRNSATVNGQRTYRDASFTELADIGEFQPQKRGIERAQSWVAVILSLPKQARIPMADQSSRIWLGLPPEIAAKITLTAMRRAGD
ncbi:MAG: hypothetical protein ACI92Z_002034, partial [Paracoccaceae bacterium]